MARKQHSMEEVLSALKAKGCVITLSTPITRTEKVLDVPTEEDAEKLYQNYLRLNNLSHHTDTLVAWASNPKTQKILAPRERNVIVVVQPAYTINWAGCILGNGSWGKIDYLCKVHGFKLSPSI